MKSAIDDALERLRHTGPEEPGGAPNHGPMAAEALVALGCDNIVPQWVDHYRLQLGPMPETVLPLTPQTWHDALGIHRRVAYLGLADNSCGPRWSRLRGLSQPVVRSRNGLSAPCSRLLAC